MRPGIPGLVPHMKARSKAKQPLSLREKPAPLDNHRNGPWNFMPQAGRRAHFNIGVQTAFTWGRVARLVLWEQWAAREARDNRAPTFQAASIFSATRRG